MIGLRRTGTLLAGLFGLFALVLARLFQVQVLEGDVWAEEAANLVRSGELVPFRRGAILDAQGRVLVRDELSWQLSLGYRDFRRGHPLGLVAHARSTLEMRPVPLEEALAELEPWALELVALSPQDLDELARGAGLKLGRLYIPGCERPELEDRRQRSADLSFYIGSLIGFEHEHWWRLKRLAEPAARALSFAELAAEWGLYSTAARARAELCARLARSTEDLRLLARLLGPEAGPAAAGAEAGRAGAVASGDPLRELLAQMEACRRGVEDLAAGWIYAQAAGFPAGRLEAGLLRSRFDLAWLARALRWDARRMDEWAEAARARWLLRWRDAQAVPALVRELAQLPARELEPVQMAERVLSLAASIYAGEGGLERALEQGPRDWRTLEDAAPLGELAQLFREAAAGPAPAARDTQEPQTLPFLAASLRALAPDPAVPWRILERAGGPLSSWAEAFEPARASERAARLEPLLRGLLDAWEIVVQAQFARELAQLVPADQPPPAGRAALASARTTPASGPLALASERVQRGEQCAPYAIKDYGSRLLALSERPGYEAVFLVTRFPERFRGFVALEAHERASCLAPGELALPGALLIGGVAASGNLPGTPESRHTSARMLELRRKARRSGAEDLELAQLVGECLQDEQERGVIGIEACFDPWLRGRNGYREQLSLEDVYGEGGGPRRLREVENGRDLLLTLDAGVQQALEHALAAPEADPDENHRDPEWLAHPVGAIVLMSVDGDVIAAASGPNPQGPLSELGPAERAELAERVLRAPGFEPPGSVFKPFVAAWALDNLGLDPSQSAPCLPQADGRGGYKGLRCSEAGSHFPGHVNLAHALKYSCNSYFAWLGEKYGGEQLAQMARCFGFGEPSGVRPAGAGGRIEDVPALPEPAVLELNRMRAANGLVVIQATPLQVARAFAGLATGVLPQVRLVQGIGGELLARSPGRAIPLSQHALDTVRGALRKVAGESRGTANRALSAAEIGWEICAKTGSADLQVRNKATDAPVKKHTWVSGWIPAERPVVVFTVYCQSTTQASSHSAVWLARQALRHPKVRALIDARIALSRAGSRAGESAGGHPGNSAGIGTTPGGASGQSSGTGARNR